MGWRSMRGSIIEQVEHVRVRATRVWTPIHKIRRALDSKRSGIKARSRYHARARDCTEVAKNVCIPLRFVIAMSTY